LCDAYRGHSSETYPTDDRNLVAFCRLPSRVIREFPHGRCSDVNKAGAQANAENPVASFPLDFRQENARIPFD